MTSRGSPKASAAITLSAAGQSDAEALVALRIRAMQESLERIGRFDPVRARERFLSTFSPEHTRHILVDGERAGFVVIKPDAEGLLLDHFYVDPRFQGRGLGGAILAMVFAEADTAGSPLRVGALRGSDSNRFYLRHGFELVKEEEWDNYYIRPAAKPR
jgi:GNAT superfamily N-acetyltransferase